MDPHKKDSGELWEQYKKLEERCNELTAENSKLKLLLKVIGEISNTDINSLTQGDNTDFLVEVKRIENHPSSVPEKVLPHSLDEHNNLVDLLDHREYHHSDSQKPEPSSSYDDDDESSKEHSNSYRKQESKDHVTYYSSEGPSDEKGVETKKRDQKSDSHLEDNDSYSSDNSNNDNPHDEESSTPSLSHKHKDYLDKQWEFRQEHQKSGEKPDQDGKNSTLSPDGDDRQEEERDENSDEGEKPSSETFTTETRHHGVSISSRCPMFSGGSLKGTLDSVTDKLLIVVIHKDGEEERFCKKLARHVLSHTPSIVLNSLDSYIDDYEKKIINFIEKKERDEVFMDIRLLYIGPYFADPHDTREMLKKISELNEDADGRIRYMLANLGHVKIDSYKLPEDCDVTDDKRAVTKFCFVRSSKKKSK